MTRNRLRTIVLAALLAAFALSAPIAQERVDLTAATATLVNLNLDYETDTITVKVRNTHGGIVEKVYNASTIPTGSTLLVGLNKADLSIKSLERRIYERLVTDGVIAGTVSGVPR